MPSSIPGIHHVTCITGDVQKCVDFYVGVLGLRFVKKSVNQDLPDTYHIYFGDYLGAPGTAMTFFGWPTWPKRRTGSGQVTAVAFAVPEDSIQFWAQRLRQRGVDHTRSTRFGADVITLHDPDGIELNLVAETSQLKVTPWTDGPVPEENSIHGFHSITLTVAEAEKTVELLAATMGFRPNRPDGAEDRRVRLVTGGGGPHAIVDVIESPEAPVGEESIGTVHHVAWRTADAATQLAWREKLVEVGRNVTPVIDRWYFKSIYYREPGGVLYEIATDGPGFTVDEKPENLGRTLSLPPWFQVRREHLDHSLTAIVVPSDLIKGRVRN